MLDYGYIARKVNKQRSGWFDLEEEYCDEMKDVDVSIRDTLVGSLRNKSQYAVNFENKFYHIPKDRLEHPDAIKYVAIYKSKRHFGGESGISHIGNVISYSVVKRCEIHEIEKEGEETLYIRFEIGEWRRLPHRLKVREIFTDACMLTNSFLMEKVYYVNELLLESNNEYVIFQGIKDVLSKTINGFIAYGVAIRKNPYSLIFATKGKMKKCFIGKFRKNPMKSFKEVMKSLNDI